MVDVAAPSDAVDLFAEGPTAQWALPVPTKIDGAPTGQQRFAFELDGLPPGESDRGALLTLTATTPLQGSGLPKEYVPANVQVLSGNDMALHRSLDLSGYMGETALGVHINDVQNNPLQPDLQYRGFLASPLLGAPQGLSLYFDGVRLNEPFGDTVN